MKRIKGALYLKRILNTYKNGGDITIDKMDVSPFEIDSGLDYLIENDQLTMYELSFLSRFSKRCKNSLQDKCSSITEEQVLCLKDRDYILSEIKIIENLINDDEARVQSLLELLKSNMAKYPRRDVEYDKKLLQIIPYMLIEHNGDLVLLKRKKCGDQRLIDSIDLPAGHCSEDDISSSIFKELSEELNISKSDVFKMKLLKCIPPTNDALSISYYHLGILVLITLNDDATIVNGEPEKHDLIKLKDIIEVPENIKSIGDWAGYGILEYFKLNNL